MSAPDPSRIAAWLATAAEILDGASEQFVAGHRADSAVAKKGNDFATEVDLAIERQVVAELTRLTGIGVHGEEFGGEPIDSELVWVLDPIDGTFNYAAGSPMAAMLLGLLWEGNPLLGLTWLPFTGQRYTSMPGGPLRCNAESLEPLTVSTTCRTRSWGSAPSTSFPAARSRAATGRRSWKTSAGSARGCACTAPPESTSPTWRPESSVAQSASAITSGTTPRGWR